MTSRIAPVGNRQKVNPPGFADVVQISEDQISIRYRARSEQHGEVLLEALRPDPATAQVRERLRQWSEAIRTIESPQVLPCLDLDAIGGRTVLVYPWPGQVTLSDDWAAPNSPDPSRSLAVIIELLLGVEAIHAAGLMHGGLCPERIHRAGDSLRIGGLGLSAGKPHQRLRQADICLAPEQILGTSADHRADLHAVGVMLWRLIAGSWPRRLATPGDLEDWARGVRPEPPSTLPGPLAAVLRKSLAADPEERYPHAQAMREDLERVAHGFAPIHARISVQRPRAAGAITVQRMRVPQPHAVPGPGAQDSAGQKPKPSRRWSLPLGLSVAAVIILVGGVVGLAMRPAPPALSAAPSAISPTPLTPPTTTIIAPIDPPWAHRAGLDAYGKWAEIMLGAESLRLRRLPAGVVQLGSPATEPGRNSDETFLTVTLTRPCWIAETELTQGVYEVLTGSNPNPHKGHNLPVTNITWDEAVLATKRLQIIVPGCKARLPTEAEWEFASSAGITVGLAASGAAPVAWNSATSGGGLHAVGGLSANARGLYDLHGNVLEWVADAYAAYPSGPLTDYLNTAGTQRSARGGSWAHEPEDCRSAARFHFMPRAHLSWLGMRLAADD